MAILNDPTTPTPASTENASPAKTRKPRVARVAATAEAAPTDIAVVAAAAEMASVPGDAGSTAAVAATPAKKRGKPGPKPKAKTPVKKAASKKAPAKKATVKKKAASKKAVSKETPAKKTASKAKAKAAPKATKAAAKPAKPAKKAKSLKAEKAEKKHKAPKASKSDKAAKGPKSKAEKAPEAKAEKSPKTKAPKTKPKPNPTAPTLYRDTLIQAPRGSELSCKTWQAEAAMRMLMNNLDPEVAEDPAHLIVYGGTGQAARNWECFDAIVAELKRLKKDETLLVQSGKPVATFRTHEDAPRVLIANSNLVGRWATWEHFNDLRARGLMMFGQMTAGSWIYIGTQGILQGTYETLTSAGEIHWGSRDLKGKLFVSGGLGGMGGAQPLAMSMAGGTSLFADVDQSRIDFRLRTKYLDECLWGLDEAIDRALECRNNGLAISVAWCGNAVTLLQRLIERGIAPDLVSDQTSAHDPLNGYVPMGMPIDKALALRAADKQAYLAASYSTMAAHVRAMLTLKDMGSHVFDYGNNLRGFAQDKGGVENAFGFPGFVPAYIRPQFCKGRGPFRWVALSGDPKDIAVTDKALLKAFPKDEGLKTWLTNAAKRVHFQGLPARICWLGYGERALAGEIFNDLVARGKVKAPIVIGRDHLDCGSVASPNRETEAMRDGTDAVADWPILNALVNTACGASWVSFHHGGGVGIGYSLHAGQVIVADGTKAARKRIRRVLTADPGMGVARHVDAGYDEAVAFNASMGESAVRIPMA